MYSIEQLQQETGTSRRTIHFYVQQGILPRPFGAGPRARYDEGHRLRLLATPKLQNAGWSLSEIRAFFQRADSATIAEVVTTGRPPREDERGLANGTVRREPLPSPTEAESATRYRLAPGIELLVSFNASERAREMVRRSLPLILELFGGDAKRI